MLKQEEKQELIDIFVNKIDDDFKTAATEDGGTVYHCLLQDKTFDVTLYDDELKNIVDLVFHIMDELENICNSGMHKENFKALKEACKNGPFSQATLWHVQTIQKMATPKLQSLLDELYEVCRVDGAWKEIIANPVFMDAIFVIYERVVDCFDDDSVYLHCIYFMIRAAMYINSVDSK